MSRTKREAHSAYMRGWRTRNKDRVNARRRKLRPLKAENINSLLRTRRKADPNFNAKQREYRRTHRNYMVAARRSNARRKAIKKTSQGSFTIAEWKLLVWLFGGNCAYCWTKPERLTIDHVMPISKGGSSYIENILPACRSCNCSMRDSLDPKVDILAVLA